MGTGMVKTVDMAAKWSDHRAFPVSINI